MLDDAKKLKARVDRARGDRAIGEEINALYDRQTQRPRVRRACSSATTQQMKTRRPVVGGVRRLQVLQGRHAPCGRIRLALAVDRGPAASLLATTLTEDPASGGKLLVPQYCRAFSRSSSSGSSSRT